MNGSYEKKRIFSITAHIDHGKTTTSDYLLRRAGLMREEDAGAICMTDFDQEEIDRGITIFTTVVLLSFKDPRTAKDEEHYLLQMNDTPGHISFTGEVSRALRGSDGAILLVDALEGVMTQTETNIRLAVGEELCKPVLFINKVDRLITQLKYTPKQVYARIDQLTTQINELIKKVRPTGSDWQVDFAKNSVSVGSAKDGWGFTYEVLKEKGLTPITVFEKYNAGQVQWLRDNLQLDDALLRMVVDHLPCPTKAAPYRMAKLWSHGDLNSELGKCLVKSDPNGPLYGMVTKIFLDPNKNYQATLIGRIFSGTMHDGETIYLINSKQTHRIKRLGVMELMDILDVPKVPAGNLFALYGFVCPAGETFIAASAVPKEKENIPPPFEKIRYASEAVVSRSVKPKDAQDLAKLGDVAGKWIMADPSASFKLNKESREYVLSGIDPLQIDILTKRINDQVKIEVGDPIIVYREKLSKVGPTIHTKSPNSHNKIQLFVEPLDEKTEKLLESGEVCEMQDEKVRGQILRDKAGWDAKEARRIVDVYEGNLLVNGTVGLQRFDRVKSYMSGAFREFVESCLLAKEPALGFKVTFTDLTIHEDPAHTGYNQIATMVAAGMALSTLQAGPHIFEPIQRIDVKVPTGIESNVIAIVNKKRGRVNNVIPDKDFMRIQAQIPASETLDLAEELRSATSGRAFFGYEFAGFEKVPGTIEKDVILDIRKRKGLKLEMPDGSSWERFIYKRT